MLANVIAILSAEYRRLSRLVLLLFASLLLLQVAGLFVLYLGFWQHSVAESIQEILPVAMVLLFLAVVVLWVLYRSRVRLEQQLTTAVGSELYRLRAAEDRARSLQAMAATLSATLSFERVVEQALDVCSLALSDMGIPRDSLVGAVFLFDGEKLVPLAKRRFAEGDADVVLDGREGALAAALQQAEPMVVDNPAYDPEIARLETFVDCLTAVCIPLRAGYQLFGIMILGLGTAVRFRDEHFSLFESVADQTVIALQNAQLYQGLEAEKQRLIDADVEARRELARDLHDGPTQNIAAIAMRLNHVRMTMSHDPQAILVELEQIEGMAKLTSLEIRGMLFTLRPLVLESRGLAAAVDTIMLQLGDSTGIETQFDGADVGELLDKQARGVVFNIIEEALSNVRKHANASAVEVEFRQEGDLFVARIQDNGDGFDEEAMSHEYELRGSLGMVNMRERAERIGGSVHLESTPGLGTTVTLLVPLVVQVRDEADDKPVSNEPEWVADSQPETVPE